MGGWESCFRSRHEGVDASVAFRHFFAAHDDVHTFAGRVGIGISLCDRQFKPLECFNARFSCLESGERKAGAMTTIPKVKLRSGMALRRGASKPVPRLPLVASDAVA